MFEPVTQFYRKYARWVPIFSFVLGFCFDLVMLRRIDELRTILQQAAYIFIAGCLIGLELVEITKPMNPPGWLKKIWTYREFLLHFLLGTLLNSYTIFYFKSASAFSSFAFIILLVALLILNEFLHFGKSQVQVHMAFWSLCITTYLVSVMPIFTSSIGLLSFIGAISLSTLIYFGFAWFIKNHFASKPELIRSHLLMPFFAVQIIFSLLYFSHAIPPVPLSVSYMGIFHEIEKEDGNYKLSYTEPSWHFWEHGDQKFYARPGDSIYCFVQVFLPASFKEKINIQVRWLYLDERGNWQSADALPFPMVGGREEGYRAFSKKSNFQPGKWRVQIETMDNQEIGRIGLTVIADPESSDRSLNTIIR